MSLELISSFLQFKIEMANGSEHKIYRFDEFSLDAERLMLYGGGSEIALAPKVVKTLAVLVEGRGEILSKDELIRAVWNDSIVEESNLSQYLYLLRKTLGRRPDGSPYIETLRRRGYRFTGNAVCSSPGERPEVRPLKDPDGPERFSFGRRRGEENAGPGELSTRKLPEAARGTSVSQTLDRRFPRLFTVFLLFSVIIIASGFAFYLRMGGSSDSSDLSGEFSITRLTNGTEVVGATISPDGKYFVYYEPDGKLYRIWVQQTGHAARNEVVPASGRIPIAMTFTPDSQFVYYVAMDVVDGPASLYRVGTLGGPVSKIFTGLSSGVSFSPDGRDMVFARNENGEISYIVRPSDGSGSERPIYTTRSLFASSAWSPDGKLIVVQTAFSSESGGCSLIGVDLASLKTVPFSDEEWEGCGRMAWSPDGKGIYMIGTRKDEGMTTRRDQVYYISYPQGRSRKITSEGSRHQPASLGVTNQGEVLAVPFNRSSQIWVMDPGGDSRSAFQITSGLTDGRSGIAPLADGRVAYISRIGENLNVWVMNSEGSDQKQLTDNPFPIEEVRSGRDGRHLIFSAYTSGKDPHLYQIGIDGTGLRQITFGPGKEIDSSLSNDGKWIVYDTAVVSGNSADVSLWKQSIDSGERIALNRTDCQMPHFSPDDKFISCVRQQRDILILSSADGALVRAIRVPETATLQHTLNFGARWTPDGKSVAYIVNENGVSNIWLHPIDGGSPKQLTDFKHGSIYHFAYSIDGTQLYLARGNQIRDAILIKRSDRSGS